MTAVQEHEDLGWTMVVPIKGTEEEIKLMSKSLPAALALRPTELIIGLDKPVNPIILEKIHSIADKHGGNNGIIIKILEVDRDPSWNFQLARTIWECYKQANHNAIYSFDIDSIPVKTVLKGRKFIGKDGIAVYSFTKRLRLKTMSDIIRYIFYRYRVMTTDYVFSGNYWIDRKMFFEIVIEDEYKKIRNGIDTYLTEKIIEGEGERFRIFTDKAIGVKAMTPQNEDYHWRQLQLGIWLGANKLKWATERQIRRRKQRSMKAKLSMIKDRPGLILNVLILLPLRELTDHMMDDADAYVLMKSFVYQHKYLYKGYKWALKNPHHPIVSAAKEMDEKTWGYQGAKYIKDLGIILVSGTGSD